MTKNFWNKLMVYKAVLDYLVSKNGLFAQVDQLLKRQIDKLAVSLESTDPDFYEGYKNARIIIDYGTRHEQTAEEPA